MSCRGDRGELTQFYLKSFFAKMVQVYSIMLVCLCSMLYCMLVNNLKTPKTIRVFT